MEYRLVAIDIDGTLLNDDYQVSPETVESVHSALQYAHLVLCTGRSLFSAKHVLSLFPHPFPLITDNGATVWDPERGVVLQRPISRDEVVQVLSYCREKGIHVDFTTAEGLYVELVDEGLVDLYQRYKVHPSYVPDLLQLDSLPVKITLTGKTSEQVDNAYDELVTRCGGELQLMRGGQYFLDCVAYGVSKGEVLSRYAEKLGIPLTETMAIGNYFNDLEMLRVAGMGVAVANAPDAIKEEADFVTDSNNRDGVRKVLEKFVLPEGVKLGFGGS